MLTPPHGGEAGVGILTVEARPGEAGAGVWGCGDVGVGQERGQKGVNKLLVASILPRGGGGGGS